uniref:ABC transporter D family member 1 n=1 Tax=Rhizophora mucronata TaxID=61149 RepID=A0A2P2MUB0_RHIMU
MVDRRKQSKIFSDISRTNNGTRRRKAARNRNPCTLANLLLKAVFITCRKFGSKFVLQKVIKTQKQPL